MERCASIPSSSLWTNPTPCHVERPIEGETHKCHVPSPHFGMHTCYCEKDF